MKHFFPLFVIILCTVIPYSLFGQAFDDVENQTPVDTPTGGDADASMDEIMMEPSKPYAGGGYAAHPVLLEYFQEKTYTYTGGRFHDEPIRYRLRMPQTTKLDKKYPLVVWFHGAGESDDDNIRQIAHLHHALNYISGKKRDDFYVLATQCPKDNPSWFSSISSEGKGDAPVTITKEIMRHLLAEYPIDRDCVTVAGLSSGGSTSWIFAADEADVVTAVAPFSSNPPGHSVLAKLKPVSIWVFNCTGDQGTPIEPIRDAVTQMKANGYKIYLTEYPSSSHDSWGPALRQDDAFGWLLAQKKGDWRSPLPGRPFSMKMILTYTLPLVFPAIIIIITMVIIRDKKLRKKRLLALQSAQQFTQEPCEIPEQEIDYENV